MNLKPRIWRQYDPPKRWCLLTSPHGFTTQKINIDIFTAVRTLDLILVKIKFLWCLIKHHVIKTYGGVEASFQI
jgi:hypothetical protein